MQDGEIKHIGIWYRSIMATAAVYFGLMTLAVFVAAMKLRVSRRFYHGLLLGLHSVAFVGFALALGGRGLYRGSEEERFMYTFWFRDQQFMQWFLPNVTIPLSVVLQNASSGIEKNLGYAVLLTSVISNLFATAVFFLPSGIVAATLSIASLIAAAPWIYAATYRWYESVTDAPNNIRRNFKIITCGNIVVILFSTGVLVGVITNKMSVDLEQAAWCLVAVWFYSVAPLLATGSSKIIEQLYEREAAQSGLP